MHLDNRVIAEGRGLQKVQTDDNFAKLSEALYVAKQKTIDKSETLNAIHRCICIQS